MQGNLGVVFLFASVACAQSHPEVFKVEPPDWWTGSSINPIRLLIRGKHLQPSAIRIKAPLKVSDFQANQRGTYLFLNVTIPPAAKPGDYPLTIQGAHGTVQASFRVAAPLPSAGRFHGVTPDDVLYLIMPDRFANGDPANDDPSVSKGLFNREKARWYHGGDFAGIIQKLPYLKSLGVTAIWLNPWYDNANRPNSQERYDGEDITDYHGYGAVDFYGVEEHFGTLATLRELVDKAHASGIKVIQDQVANHTGPYHPWTEDPPTPAWYHGTPASHPDNDWQTWTLMDPSATPAIQRRTLDGWFINILPDLNQSDIEVRRYTIQNSLWWVAQTGLDAIRQDTLPYVPRTFWSEWTAALRREYPRLNVIGEVFDGDPALVSFFQGGAKRFDGVDSGVQALFDFPLFFPLRRAFLEGAPLRDVAKALARDHLYVNPSLLVTFAGLHDVSRFMGERGATPQSLKLALATLFTLRGIPMIYYGDEIGLPGGNDPDNRRDFPARFSPGQEDMVSWVRKVSALRRETLALRRGAMRQLFVDDHSWVFARTAPNQTAVVAINNDSRSRELKVELPYPAGTPLNDRLGALGRMTVTAAPTPFTLPPKSISVLLP